MSVNKLIRGYELLYILKPHQADEVYKEHLEAINKIITDNDGVIDFSKSLGIKTLATPIDKDTQGHFIQAQFQATNKVLEAIKKRFSVDETLLRFLIVKLESIQPAKA